MIFFRNPYTNPFFNLAAEEFLLTRFPQGFAMLWQNENTVVVGKHQNALAEINFEHVYRNNISLARRISGGGTVYHDIGNLNFTIALPVLSETKIIDFRKFIDPVIDYLQTLGIRAEPSGRNDILVNNLKISGNAEHHFRKQKLILHHGTLLFDSDLQNLGKAIKPLPDRYTDKAVQSKRSPVANIRPLLPSDMDLQTFRNGLAQHLITHFGVTETRDFTCEETDYIEALAVSKFEKDEWNLGYSPAYSFRSKFRYEDQEGEIFLNVARDSHIQEAIIVHPNKKLFGEISQNLTGAAHFPERIDRIIKKHVDCSDCQDNKLHPLTFSFF